MNISETSVHRILVDDLQYRAYKIVQEPALTEEQKERRKKFAHWAKNNFNKDDLRKWMFSDEKQFDIDGEYNSQNTRIWASNGTEAKVRGGVKKTRKFPARVMLWLGACSEGLSPLVIFDKDSVNHEVYIKEVLPVALKFGNRVLGNN